MLCFHTSVHCHEQREVHKAQQIQEKTLSRDSKVQNVFQSKLSMETRSPPVGVKREVGRKGPTSSSEHEGPKTPDPKTFRRLAQNREAARKSRLRKKAYVQQLESSRIKLTQIEQELQRARSQAAFLSAVVGSEVAEVAAQAAVTALSESPVATKQEKSARHVAAKQEKSAR